MIDVPAIDTLRIMRRTGDRRPFHGPGFADDYLLVKRMTGDRGEQVVGTVLRRHLVGGLNDANMIRHVTGLPYIIDRLEFDLLRRQGVHAAAAIAIAVGNGAKGLTIVPEEGASARPWIHPAMRPTRGGRVVHLSPILSGGVIKDGNSFMVRTALPETVKQSLRRMRGARLRDVISHPLLDHLDIRVTSAATTGHPDPTRDLLIVRTDLGHEDVALADILPQNFAPIRE